MPICHVQIFFNMTLTNIRYAWSKINGADILYLSIILDLLAQVFSDTHLLHRLTTGKNKDLGFLNRFLYSAQFSKAKALVFALLS